MKLKQISHLLLLTLCLLSLHKLHSQNVSLDILTNSKTEDSLIAKYASKRQFNSLKELQVELKEISRSLYQEGYLQHTFRNLINELQNTYTVEFASGRKTRELVLYIYDEKIIEFLKRSGYKTGNNSITIQPKEISTTLNLLSKNAAENGEPLTTFQLINISVSETTASAELKIRRQEKRDLTAIEIKGYDKFPRAYIKHHAKLRTPSLFQKKEILEKTRSLENLEFITFSKTPELQFNEDNTSLYLYIDKKNANLFEGFLGFGSNEDDSKLRLDGYINLKLQNNFNYGEQINLTYKGNGDNQQTLNINTQLPFIFKSPFSFSAGIKIFRQDSTFSNTSQFAATSLNITANSAITLSADFEQSTIPQNSLHLNNETYNKQIYTGEFSYNNKEGSQLQPESALITLTAGTAFRKTQSSNITNQFVANLNAGYNFTINSSHHIHLSNKTAILLSETYLNNELFRFGGINSIRGFKENSIVSNTYSTLQTEYRFSPNPKIYFNTVMDAAYFENDLINQEELIYSFGLGASLLTNAGVLKINLANGIQNSQKFDFSNSILHLTLISKF